MPFDRKVDYNGRVGGFVQKGFHRFHFIIRVMLSLLAGGALVSCAPPEEDSYTSECSIPSDQSQSITGRWSSNPVYISFRDGQFTAVEMGLIMDAADTWNQFYGMTSGFQIIDYGTRAYPRTTLRDKPINLCSNSLINAAGQFTGSITIYKDTVWPSGPAGYPAGAIAITSNCTSTAAPFDKLYIAIMELNFQNFFVSGTPTPDLTSILVHEFGHLLGLDHSCAQTYDSGKKTHPPLCSSSSLNPEYYQAAMYPVVNFNSDGSGTVRRNLGANDQKRANCLYGSQKL